MRFDQNAVLVISLDFELYWGVRDSIGLPGYRDNLLGVWEAIPAILKIFSEYSIHATWACVGFLFFDNWDELKKNLPVSRPHYVRTDLDPYKYVENVGNDAVPACHFARPLIEKIRSYPHQEIASHTFSHYYCLEKGQTGESFAHDLDAAIDIAEQAGISIESLVFPRNQINEPYLTILKTRGIKAFRGNEDSWLYRGSGIDDETLLRRALRLLDAYLNLTGSNTLPVGAINNHYPCNIPSSRFLRPYSKRLKMLDGLKLKRITSDLKRAARDRHIYHLWWHPHNFGVYREQNLAFLREILECYSKLHCNNEMESLTMAELARRRVEGEWRA